MSYDVVLETVGEFGRSQKLRTFLLCLPGISCAIHNLALVFNMAVPDFRCAIPGYENDTYLIQNEFHESLVNLSIPRDESGKYSQCSLYRHVNGTNEGLFQFSKNETKSCEKWVYSKAIHEITITSQLDLVCDQKDVRTHTSMMMLLGLLVGSLIGTPVADVFGRKKVIVAFAMLQMILGVITFSLDSIPMLLFLRFGTSFASIVLFITFFVQVTEIVGPSQRAFVGVCTMYAWAVGMFVLLLVFYFIRDYRIAQLVVSVPGVFYISYWWLIPESPRWLITKSRYQEACDILREMARVNKRPLPESVLNDLLGKQDEPQQKLHFWQVFNTPKLAGRFIILCYNWLALSMCYYGLTLNTAKLLGGDLYSNFAFISTAELCAHIVCHIFLDRVGRNKLYCVSMLLGGLACLATLGPTLANKALWVNTVLSNLGKFGCSICFTTVFVFTSELLPTFVRNSGMGFCSFVGRIGGLISPYIAQADLPGAMPLVIFGAASVLAGLLALLLPETKKISLPDTMEDVNNIERLHVTHEKNMDDKESSVPLKHLQDPIKNKLSI